MSMSERDKFCENKTEKIASSFKFNNNFYFIYLLNVFS